MRFVVKRKEWNTIQSVESKPMALKLGKTIKHGIGRKKVPEELQGKKCCLGFLAEEVGRQCGLSESYISRSILGCGDPLEINSKKFDFEKVMDMDKNDIEMLCDSAIYINDNPEMTRKEKEKELRSLFKEYDQRIIFEC